MKKKALITGICGQDGHYLTKLLLEKDYQVVGIDVQEKINETDNPNSIELLDTDLTNMQQVINLIKHGRALCRARSPLCTKCPLLNHCPYGKKHTK